MDMVKGIIGLVLGLIILITFLPIFNAIIGVTNSSAIGGSTTMLMYGALILIFVIAILFSQFFSRDESRGGDVNGTN